MILYVARTGMAWEYLPHDFPPAKTVDDYYAKWESDGTTARIHDLLRSRVREALGRDAEPCHARLGATRSDRPVRAGARGHYSALLAHAADAKARITAEAAVAAGQRGGFSRLIPELYQPDAVAFMSGWPAGDAWSLLDMMDYAHSAGVAKRVRDVAVSGDIMVCEN